MTISICTSEKIEMHPVLLNLQQCFFSLVISFSLIYIFDKCFGYLLVCKKCTHTLDIVCTQCIIFRTNISHMLFDIVHFTSFHRSFSIFLVFIFPHSFVVLFFNLFFSHRYNRCYKITLYY